MKMRTILLTFIQIIVVVNCAVFEVPNKDDREYWHNYNIKFLNKILKSQTTGKNEKVARNVIVMIGDGMSFATIAAGRVMKGQKQGKSGEETEVVFESFPHVGLSKTYNTDSQVPDSAATATAIYSGVKTAIRVLSLASPASPQSRESDRLKNIVDWAQSEGKRTGVVTTTRLTHATPAAAYSFSYHRDFECDKKVPDSMKSYFKDIARQLVENKPGKNLNVIFGGGRDYFGATDEFEKEPIKFGGGAEISCKRTDNLNLVEKYLNQFDNNTIAKYVSNTGEMIGLDFDNVDHVMGIFANNHMHYESLRNTNSDGQPSLTEMTKAAIKILNNRKNKNGYLLIVEGGKIDHAHHQNHARLALEEFVEFERAVQQAKDMTSEEDTLIIVTSDHAHAMVYNGYAKRGNDILDFGNTRVNSSFYETLTYATGPGYFYHMMNETNSTKGFVPTESFSSEKRRDPLYMHKSLIPMGDSVHGGEDVGVFSIGPGSNLLQSTFEQCYIAYAISYASCIGPVSHMNPACSKQAHSNGIKLTNNYLLFLLIFYYLFISIRKFLH